MSEYKQMMVAKLAKLPDTALVVTKLSLDCTYWSAWLAKAPKTYGGPDFLTGAGTEAEAITQCAAKIRTWFQEKADMYTYDYVDHWAERAKKKAPTNLTPDRTTMYDPAVNDTKWGYIRQGSCGYIEGSGEAMWGNGWEDMLESVLSIADAETNCERRVHQEFERLRTTHKEFRKTFLKFMKPYVKRAWDQVHEFEAKYNEWWGIEAVACALVGQWIEQGKLEAQLQEA